MIIYNNWKYSSTKYGLFFIYLFFLVKSGLNRMEVLCNILVYSTVSSRLSAQMADRATSELFWLAQVETITEKYSFVLVEIKISKNAQT